jgi:HTH domain.
MTNTLEAEGPDMGDPGRIPATTPDDVLDVFATRDDRGEPLTAPELAERLNCSRRTALNKLHDLADRGDVASKKAGGRSKVWWRPIPRDQSSHANAGESAPESNDVSAGDGGDRSTAPHGGEIDTFDRDGWRDRLTKEVPRSGAVAERRADAILKMYDYLREHGEGENDELTDLVDPDVVELGSAESFWSNVVKGKDTLRALPGVEKPPDGVNDTWKYRPAGDGEGDE